MISTSSQTARLCQRHLLCCCVAAHPKSQGAGLKTRWLERGSAGWRCHSLQGTDRTYMRFPQPLVQEAKQQHKATVFVLHGLGDTAHGWAHVAPLWAPHLPHVKFVFPTAPSRPITLSMGAVMPGWYDISSLEKIEEKDDEEGVGQSCRYLEDLIQKEIEAGIPSSSIAVVGFSQGGAIALMMLRSNIRLAAIVGMSTYLVLRSAPKLFASENASTPVLLCHGDSDRVVYYKNCKLSLELLQQAGVDVKCKVYKGMEHSACQEEFDDVKDFLLSALEV